MVKYRRNSLVFVQFCFYLEDLTAETASLAGLCYVISLYRPNYNVAQAG